MDLSDAHHTASQDIASLLRQRRRALDLTRNELARRVGCSPDTIKKIEEGERRPSKQLARLLAENLYHDPAARTHFILLSRERTSTADDGPSNLPAPLTSFIGRSHEVEMVSTLLRRGDVRLLTIMGPPGVGKSRLAVHAAQQLHSAFPAGVWFVPLATVEDPEQTLLSIAISLKIPGEATGTSLDWLVAALKERRGLLLLDNFEQIVEAAPQITTLLNECAQLTILTTSRAPLDVYGEHRLMLPPFPTPPPTAWNDPDLLNEYAAVRLFVARVEAHNPGFQLSEENCAAIAELCMLLDGIPLAIELAAGQTRAESPKRLLGDVKRDGRLALLTTTQRDRTARQQTLREAIAWSVRRLAPEDQLLFARLGVFHGAFDLAAAHRVAGVTTDEKETVTPETLAARLQTLAAGHLVQIQSGGARPLYKLLETLREYALDALQGQGILYATQRRHAHHYATLAAAVDPAQTVGNFHTWREQIRADYADLMAALHFALIHQDADIAFKLVSGLGHFWYLEGSWQEGVTWLQQALALANGPIALRARANTELGILFSALGRYQEAEVRLNQARDEATQAADPWAIAWTLAQMSQTSLLQGHIATTRAYTLERLQIYRQVGDLRYLAITLEQLGCAAVEEGDYGRGIPWLEECRSLWAAQDSRSGVAATELIIGMAELAEGYATAALARFQHAHAEFDALQHSHGLPWSLRNLGLAYLALGQVPQAQQNLQRSFERYTALTGSETSTIVVVEAVAGMASRLGQHRLAAHLMGAASIARQAAQLPLTENSRQIYARLLAPSIKTLGQDPWEQALTVGASLPWSEAVAQARNLLFLPLSTQ